MTHPLRIRRDERGLALLALLIFVLLNALNICRHDGMILHHVRGGFWSLFFGHYHVSGYDSFIYLTLCRMQDVFARFRHPLLAILIYPFSVGHQWLMTETGLNLCHYIVGLWLVAAGVYSFVLLHRILHELVGVGRRDSLLLTLFLFSMGHIMVASVVPDHFAFSLLMLLLSLYVMGRHLREGTPVSPWVTGALMLLTSGITTTNGLKPLIADWMMTGRHFWRPRRLLVTTLIPTMLLAGACYVQYGTGLIFDYHPQPAKTAEAQPRETFYAHWIRTQESRTEALVHNVFGEGLMLHRDHLLEDVNGPRPVIVPYRHALQYGVGAVIALLLAGGMICGRHDRLMQLCMAWTGLDALLHIGFGFGLNEPYIFTAHWAFVIPLAAGTLMVHARGPWRHGLRALVALLTLGLWAYNGTLLTLFMTR